MEHIKIHKQIIIYVPYAQLDVIHVQEAILQHVNHVLTNII